MSAYGSARATGGRIWDTRRSPGFFNETLEEESAADEKLTSIWRKRCYPRLNRSRKLQGEHRFHFRARKLCRHRSNLVLKLNGLATA